MAKVIGSVDLRGRPVIRIDGKHESLLFVVDTGFNGALMVGREAARALAIDPITRETDVELGDGKTVLVNEGRATIQWMGQSRRVRVFVSNDWLPSDDDPVGLLGTDLLAPHLLLIDFASGLVEIETQE